MQQFAIAPGDHGAGTAQQPHHGVSGGRGLPLVAGELSGPEDDLGDFLLGGAGSYAVDRLKHATGARQLLPGHTCVGRNTAPVERRQEAGHGLDAIKALGPERDDGCKRLTGGCLLREQEMEMLAVAEIVQDVQPVLGNVDVGKRQ